MKDNKSGWQFPKALEIIKCKEGNKEFMKERPARRPFGNTVLICEYPIDDTAAEEPNAKLITWRLAKRAARDFLRVSFMPSAIVSAVYPVVGLPQLDKESLLTIFDVPEKDRDNYFVKTLGVPAGISFEDTDETERHVEREGISIIYSGRTLKPIRTTRGLVFIESRYLSPVADVLDVLELYERRTAEGAPYIVAKAGFLLQAVIMPYDVINQQFVESLQDLTRECEFSLSEKERREREARDRFTFTEPEQCSLNVDPDTGEVVEESEVADE